MRHFLADVGIMTWGIVLGIGLLLCFVLWVEYP